MGLPVARTWALEDCRHLTRRLEADLLKGGEAVLRVQRKPMAGARRSARERGKSDPIDALSVARAPLRELNLPSARLDGIERELRLLVDHRDVLKSPSGRATRPASAGFSLSLGSPSRLRAPLRGRSCWRVSTVSLSAGLSAWISGRPHQPDPGANELDRGPSGERHTSAHWPSLRRSGPPRLRSPDGRQARR